MNTTHLHDIAVIRKVALCIGIASLAIAAAMSFSFGAAMSFKHAALLALLTFAGSIVWPYIGHLKVAGMNRKATAFAVAGTLFLAVELFSHVGFSVGTRVMETEDTGFQNARSETIISSAKREGTNLEFWRDRLAKLEQQNEWAATVKAEAMRAQIAPLTLAIEQETRRGGCGPKCLKLTQDKADVEAKIATAEEREDLTQRIAAAERLIDTKEEAATSVEYRASPVVAQTMFVSQLATLELEPGEGALTWTQIAIGFLIALVTTFLAPVMISIAFGPVDLASGARSASEKPDAAADKRPAPRHAETFSAPANDIAVRERVIAWPDAELRTKLRGWAHQNEQRLAAA